jgi:hypothetical protein
MAIRNNGFMSFTNVNGPQVRPLLDKLFDQSPGSIFGFLSNYGPALMADLIAVISICALVMLQIWVGLAFLTNAGSYDNAFKLSFYSIVTAFALVRTSIFAVLQPAEKTRLTPRYPSRT